MEKNKWDEMRAAYREAETQIRAADIIINEMARILRGRLRNVSYGYLTTLKRELRDYNIHTRKWKT